MFRFRKLLAVLFAAVMVLSLAGCGDTRWICEVDGNSIPSGLYIYYQMEGYGDAIYQLAQQDSETYFYPYIYYYNMGYVDPTLFEAEMENGQTVEEYINSYALDMCKQVTVVDKLFTDLGLSLTDDEKALVESQLNSAWSSGSESFEKIGIGKESVKLALESKIKETRVFDAYYEVGGKNGTTEEEITDYFADNYARVKYMTFTFADSVDDAVDEARKNEQLELANSYLEEAKAGTPMDELIDRHNEELAAEEADEEADETDEDADTDEAEPEETEETEDSNEAEAEEEYPHENILSKDSTYPTEKFVNYVFTTVNEGDFAVIQDDTCFYVVQRLDVRERTDLYDSYRDSIMQELFDSDFTALINTELAKYTVTVNDNATKRYKAKNAFPDSFED